MEVKKPNVISISHSIVFYFKSDFANGVSLQNVLNAVQVNLKSISRVKKHCSCCKKDDDKTLRVVLWHTTLDCTLWFFSYLWHFSCDHLHRPPMCIHIFCFVWCITATWDLGQLQNLTCNQGPSCRCQGTTVNCQLTKEWKESVLGLVHQGFSRQESSGVSSPQGIMDSPRQWNTIPSGLQDHQTPERLSQYTPHPPISSLR